MSRCFVLGSEENIELYNCAHIAKHIKDLYVPLSDKGQYKIIRQNCLGRITGLHVIEQDTSEIKTKDLETILPLSVHQIPLHCVDIVILLPCTNIYTITLFLQAVQKGTDKTFILYCPREDYHTGLLQLLKEYHLFEKRNIKCYTTLKHLLENIK